MAKTDEEIVLGQDGESGWEDSGLPPGPSDVPESPFKAPEKEHKAQTHVGRGRPEKELPALGIPDPKFRLFKSDATNINQRVKPFLNYWNGLPQWAKENTLLYVYRDHPVLKYIEKDPENREQEFNYIDKISGAEPLQDEMDVLNRYGCGNYKLVFNAIEPKKPNRTLCTVYVVNLGNNDFKSNPPTDRRISDSKNVDLEHPNNKAYVAYLRGVGLLPSQIDAIKGEQEMASIELVKEQQSTTNKLVDALVDKAKEKPAAQDPGFMERAVTGAMEVVKEGSKAAIQITREANDYANRVREEADKKTVIAPLAPATDPLTLALQIVELIKGGKDNGDTEVIALRAQIDKLRDDQVSILRDELKSMRESRITSSSTNPFDYMKSGMEALRGMKSTIDEITGGGEKEAAESLAETAADAAGAPKWLTRYAPLAQQAMSMIEGFFRMRTPPGAYPPGYVPPGQGYSPQAPGYSPQAPYAPPQQQWAPPGGPVPNPPGPQLVPGPRHPLATLDPSQFTPELSQLLSSIAVPLQIHLSEEVDGTEFANWFMGGYGEATHQEIAALGPDVVVGALYSHPATLQSVQSFTPEKVRVFVEEFLNPQFDEQTPQVEETPAPTGPIPA